MPLVTGGHDMNTKSQKRSEKLTIIAQEFYKFKEEYKNKIEATKDIVIKNKQRMLDYFQVSENEWNNWKWQMAHRIHTSSLLKEFFSIDDCEIENINKVSQQYRWGATPYYLSQIRFSPKQDPFYLQAIPSIEELSEWGTEDPMEERFTNPAGMITRRYPDRAIINVTNICPSYCRHCQRRRNIGTTDSMSPLTQIKESIDYIKSHPEIRDVLITGGDALTLSDDTLDNILACIREIPSVEIIRLGTRTLVTLPQRITQGLINILEKYAPIYINTQFNHPLELSEEACSACRALVSSGIVLGNQMVFLRGINDSLPIVQLLNQLLLANRVRPYYIFHPKEIIGTGHFYVPVSTGLKIMKGLRGYTSGLALPTYVYNSPKGWGKIPLSPEGIDASQDKENIYIETWEGRKIIINKN